MKIVIALALLAASTAALAVESHAVKGYWRNDGVYVPPHIQTNSNGTKTDNYTYPGNYNPNTGRISR